MTIVHMVYGVHTMPEWVHGAVSDRSPLERGSVAPISKDLNG